MFPCPLSHSLPNGKKCTKVITFTLYDEAPESPKAHAQVHFLLFLITDCVLRCCESHIFVEGGGRRVKTDSVEDEP